MKKRTLSLLLALVMVIGLLPMTAQAGELDNGLLYEVYGEHVEITGYTGAATEVMIPAEIEGLPVTVIGGNAFGCSNVVSISIPDGVTEIGDNAFSECTNLTSIVIPDSVTQIGGSAFHACFSLDNVSIPAGVTQIARATFYGCWSLSHIEIPDSITQIDDLAFLGCKSLTSIRFNGNAPRFGEDIFYNVNAIAYYPIGNTTWTADVMQNYGGTILWRDSSYSNPFTDVPAGSYFEIPALWAQERGITSGTAPNKFSPYDSCLRSQVVTFLWRAAGKPAPKSQINPFVDVKPGDYYYDAVLWAVEQGITTGADATHFEPNGVCNRAQVVTFLWRANGSPQVSVMIEFTDVEPGYYLMAVGWALVEGITRGISDTLFGPNDVCNRSQVVTFLFRAYN